MPPQHAKSAFQSLLRKDVYKRQVESIREGSQNVRGKDDITRVASVSANDESIGVLIADAMEKVTNDGVITVEESKTMGTNLEVVEGMQFDRGYVSAYMATDVYKRQRMSFAISTGLRSMRKFRLLIHMAAAVRMTIRTKR